MNTQNHFQSNQIVGRSQRRTPKVLTCLAALTAAFGALATGAVAAHANDGVAGATQPDYANVGNPLGEITHLMRDDDLVLTLGNEVASPAGEQFDWISTISTSNSVGTQCASNNGNCVYNYHTYDNEQSPLVGRFFRRDTDSIVQYPAIYDGTTPAAYFLYNFLGANGGYQYAPLIDRQPLTYGVNSTTLSRAAVGDFTGDGYDDILMVYADWSTQFSGNGRARLVTPVDRNNPGANFNFGPQQSLGFIYGVRSVAAGDFNGDGRTDFAVLYVDNNQDPNIAVYSVNDDMTVTLQNTNVLLDPVNDLSVNAPMQLIAGTFTPAGNQQLVLIQTSASLSKTKIRVFDFDNSRSWYYPYEKGNLVTDYSWATNVKLVAGQFDWGSPTQSLAAMLTKVNNGNSQSDVQILRIDPVTYDITVAASVNVPKDLYNSSDKNYVALDIAAGNFDNYNQNADGGVGNRNPNQQLAIATGYCQGTNLGLKQFQVKDVSFYDVIDPTSGAIALKQRSAVAMKTFDGTSGKVTRMSIAAADLHGRSLRLGTGNKIRIDRTSPTMILAQPPAHVDYVNSSISSASPTVLNLSLAPDKFNSEYSTTSSTDNTESESSTKGWSFSGKESVGTTLTFGKTSASGALQDGIQISETFTAQQDLNSATDTKYGTSTSTSQTIATQTGMNDVVWYDDGYSYVYVYEVAGKTVCPSGQTTCDDSAKVPMTVMFSAPGANTANYISAESLEWYQPAWENGNVLSYPGNTQQLWYSVPNPTMLNASQVLRTDSSTASVSTNWAATQQQGENVSSSKVFAENSETSVEGAGSVYIAPFIEFSATDTLNLDFGGSDSLSSVRTKNTTITQSSGLTLSKGAWFRTPSTYGYAFSPVIFGQSTPPDYFDGTDPKTPGSGLPPVTTQLNVFGPMRTAFTVDPIHGGGAWFQQMYHAHPDIALNHPFRWTSLKPGASIPEPDNCIGTGDGYMDCSFQAPRTPNDPWDDSFHKMRGFFVYKSDEADPANPANQGIQQNFATAGDQLTLEARVYNYSLATMAPGSHVKVNFYAMLWNKATGLPADYVDPTHPGGKSFLIGQYSTGPIQPFNTDTANPNFVLANVHFDTTGHDNQYLAFWVMAWGENADGTMMQELDGKGLTSDPGSSTAASFFDFTGLEPLVVNQWSADEPQPDGGTPMTSFSNNIGFYPMNFQINGPPARLKDAKRAQRVGLATAGDARALGLSAVDVQKTALKLGESTEIDATVHNPGDPMRVATAYFYDGNPDLGGKLAAVQRLTFIDSNQDHKVRVRYAPPACGPHDIYMRVGHQGVFSRSTKSVDSIHVTCDPPNPAAIDGGACGDAGTLDAGSGGSCVPSDSDGGCSASPRHSEGGWGWLAPLGAVAAFGLRRKQKVAAR